MHPTELGGDAKEALRKAVRALRERLPERILSAAKGEYRLDVAPEKAQLPEARRERRARLEAWLDEQGRGRRVFWGIEGEPVVYWWAADFLHWPVGFADARKEGDEIANRFRSDGSQRRGVEEGEGEAAGGEEVGRTGRRAETRGTNIVTSAHDTQGGPHVVGLVD